MRFSVAAVAALAAGVSAGNYSTPVFYTTDVVTSFTTYCPASTTLTHNGVTYTVSSATTLTITNCPCTITKPVSTPVPVAPVSVAPVASPIVSPIFSNTTAPAAAPATPATTVPGAAAPTTATTPSKAPLFSSPANKAFAASGAGLAGLVGLAAYIL
ncbi:MAG: hypothetical protein M1838_002949 [Thelocarpon superellum]|nr:MAG: hypothetical protein M1838_002949 [Thelocarpon superellum]